MSQKKVYRCELCDRWFCEKHIEPKLSFMRNFNSYYSPEVEALYSQEYKREDGHPDFEYSRRKFAELDIEERERSELIKDALDRMNAHYKRSSKPTHTKPVENKPFISEGKYHFEKRKTSRRKVMDLRTKLIIVLSVVFLLLLALMFYSYGEGVGFGVVMVYAVLIVLFVVFVFAVRILQKQLKH